MKKEKKKNIKSRKNCFYAHDCASCAELQEKCTLKFASKSQIAVWAA